MGEVFSMAATIDKRRGCLPRDLYLAHLDEPRALMTDGAGTR